MRHLGHAALTWRRTAGTSLLVASACFIAPSVAQAEASGAEQAAADSLFDSAIALMKDGKYKEACPKLKKSHTLDPAVGTLLNLGLCYSESHQIASAWSTYREAAALAARQGQADREAHARSKADELDDRLTRIRLVVSEEVLALPGLSVRVAGVEVSGVLLEEPFPVDAGTIEVVASATGYEETTLSIDAQKEGVTVDVPIESLQQVGARDDEAAAQDKDEQPSERKEGGGGGWQRPVGWAAVGVGTAGIATGVVTGLIAQSKYKSLDCANDVCTDPEDESGVNTVNTMRTVSPVAFIVGGVLAVAGVTLVLTAPKAEQVASLSPYVALDGVGLWGSF